MTAASRTTSMSKPTLICPRSIPGQFKKMDCITCHNRITHLVLPPADRVDQMLSRKLIDPAIPEIRLRGTEVLERHLRHHS